VPYESAWNVVWLAVIQALFYLFLTMYCTPYFALVPELGHTSEMRLHISMWVSITWAAGNILAAGAPYFAVMVSDPLVKLRIGVVTICAVAVVFMYIPVLYLDERRYCEAAPCDVPMVKALKHCVGNVHFRSYVAADFCFFFATSLVSTGMPYYLRVLADVDDSLLPLVMGGLVLLSFLWYRGVSKHAMKHGKKGLVLVGLFVFSLLFFCIYFIGNVPIPPLVQIFCIPMLGSPAFAILGVLPNAILSDIAVHDSVVTGQNNEGMFFAARTLLQKFGVSMGIMVFASLTNFGKSPGDDLGIRLSGFAGMATCLLGAFAFAFYRERDVLAVVDQHTRSIGEAVRVTPAGDNPRLRTKAEAAGCVAVEVSPLAYRPVSRTGANNRPPPFSTSTSLGSDSTGPAGTLPCDDDSFHHQSLAGFALTPRPDESGRISGRASRASQPSPVPEPWSFAHDPRKVAPAPETTVSVLALAEEASGRSERDPGSASAGELAQLDLRAAEDIPRQ